MAHEQFLERALPEMDVIHNLARRLTRDPGEAEDLVQETYLKAFEAWGRSEHPDSMRAWLATICLNLARSGGRKRSSRPSEVSFDNAPEAVAPGPNPEELALRSLDREAIHYALLGLPEEQRIAVTLVDICGFSASETARLTKCPRGTVLSRVHRGRKALAKLVEQEAVTDET